MYRYFCAMMALMDDERWGWDFGAEQERCIDYPWSGRVARLPDPDDDATAMTLLSMLVEASAGGASLSTAVVDGVSVWRVSAGCVTTYDVVLGIALALALDKTWRP